MPIFIVVYLTGFWGLVFAVNQITWLTNMGPKGLFNKGGWGHASPQKLVTFKHFWCVFHDNAIHSAGICFLLFFFALFSLFTLRCMNFFTTIRKTYIHLPFSQVIIYFLRFRMFGSAVNDLQSYSIRYLAYFLLSLGSGSFKRAPGSFLFSLVNPSGLPPTKMPLIAGQEGTAIYCNSDYGPTFGGNHDLRIPSAPNSTAGYVNLNNTYQCPAGQNCNTFLTGNQNFIVNEMEVFGFEK